MKSAGAPITTRLLECEECSEVRCYQQGNNKTSWFLKEQGETVKGRHVMRHFNTLKHDGNQSVLRYNTNSNLIQFGSGTSSKSIGIGEKSRTIESIDVPLHFFTWR